MPARQDLARHATPRLARLHVLRRVQAVALSSAVGLPQRVCVKQVTRDAAQLVDDVDAQDPDEVIHLLLRLRVQPQPSRLQRSCHQQAVR